MSNKSNSEILSRIKKLLALGKSPNSNEASSAILKAQELMKQYGIVEVDVNQSEITEESFIRQGGKKPPRYETYLSGIIARAFGCKIIYDDFRDGTRWIYIGLAHKAEIASYMNKVIFRKLKNSRREYLKTLRRCSRATKMKRADDFCLGWVVKVAQKLVIFTNSAEENRDIASYVERNFKTEKLDICDRNSRRLGHDFFQGTTEAEAVELHNGVGGNSKNQKLLL